MKCERCGKDDAVVKLTRIERTGSTHQICLCQVCAAEASPYQKKILQKKSSMDDILKELLKQQKLPATAAPTDTAEEAARVPATAPCPHCGLEYASYRSTMMLGCPDCYEAFAEQLEPELQRYHRAAAHSAPGSEGPGMLADLQERLGVARSELKSAVEYEDYERAAFLRDEISRMEKQIRDARKGGGEE